MEIKGLEDANVEELYRASIEIRRQIMEYTLSENSDDKKRLKEALQRLDELEERRSYFMKNPDKMGENGIKKRRTNISSY